MPSNLIPLKDVPITRGMNTVDNSRDLQQGECVQLTNAMPGNPLKIRKGNFGKLMASTENYRFIPPAISFDTGSGIVLLVWVYDSSVSNYKLLSIPETSIASFDSIGGATFSGTPFFSLLTAHRSAYVAFSPAMSTWESDTEALSLKVVEEDGETVRDMCIAAAGSISTITQTGDDSDGVFEIGDFFSYAFTYVRRTDTDAFEDGTSPAGMIFPPDVSEEYTNPEPKRIDTYLPGSVEGVEDITEREVVEITDDSTHTAYYATVNITNSHSTAIAQGATHIRVWRTRRQADQESAEGATHFFLFDLPLAVTTVTFDDKTSDATLSGETNQLTVTGYSAAPNGRFIEYVKERIWIFGVSGNEGVGYYSEIPGGDGSELETALTYPQKFNSLFKPLTYRVDCDEADKQEDMGLARLGDDLYFFRERKIFCLFGGNPTAANPTLVSPSIGCAFPHTITKCDVKAYFGTCILFLSNQGPAVIQEGGTIRLFSEFKVKQLWPEEDTELYSELDSHWDWIQANCTAAFFKNNWIVMYKTYSGTYRWFNYYFDPALAVDGDAPRGAWEGVHATV